MGKLADNPRRALLRIKVNQLNYRQTLALLHSVNYQLTENVAIFPTPPLTAPEIGAILTALTIAITGLGTKKNKGSHAQVLAAKDFH